MKGIGDLMKQANQMQQNMRKMREELAQLEVVGESGAGLVRITLSGCYEARGVVIDSSLLQEQKELIEDLLAAAINDAVHKVEAANADKMSAMTGGIELPPGFKLPF